MERAFLEYDLEYLAEHRGALPALPIIQAAAPGGGAAAAGHASHAGQKEGPTLEDRQEMRAEALAALDAKIGGKRRAA